VPFASAAARCEPGTTRAGGKECSKTGILATGPDARRDIEAEMDALTEIQPASQLEDEDVYDLIVDCQSFIAEVMERRLPKSVERQGSLLLGRLNASLDWQTVH
jgi:hypothetical protein